jgi:inner membrane protein
MDPLTHLLTGACLGRSGFNRKTAYATLAMTLAAEAPDLDVLWGVRGPLAAFQHHRGITHTLLGAPLVALVVTGAVWLFARSRRWRPRREGLPAPRWLLIWLFAWIAVLSHILLDYSNSYGVRPFFPFSPRWYRASVFFIVDPMVLALLIFGLLMPGIFGWVDRELTRRRTPFRGRGWAVFALLGVVVWAGVRSSEHAHALKLIGQTSFGDEPAQRAAAEPYPFDPFHWQAIVESRDYYQLGDVRTRTDEVGSEGARDRIAKPSVTPAVAAAKRSLLGQVYLSWSEFPLVEDLGPAQLPDAAGANEHTVEEISFQDLRFGFGGWLGGRSGNRPLSGTVYIGRDGSAEATYFDGKAQP